MVTVSLAQVYKRAQEALARAEKRLRPTTRRYNAAWEAWRIANAKFVEVDKRWRHDQFGVGFNAEPTSADLTLKGRAETKQEPPPVSNS